MVTGKEVLIELTTHLLESNLAIYVDPKYRHNEEDGI